MKLCKYLGNIADYSVILRVMKLWKQQKLSKQKVLQQISIFY